MAGAALGVAVGGAYFSGSAAAHGSRPDTAVERLSRAAAARFSDQALERETATMSPGALAAARRHDPAAAGPEGDRQAALAAAAAISRQPLAAKAGPAARPFQFSGALDSSRDLDCLSAAIYYEARGETGAGQAAVAQVVLNRARHPAFPHTVCGVVYQGANAGGCQFTFACDGSMRRERETGAWQRARAVAARALNGYVMSDVGEAVNFHVATLGSPWGAGMIRVSQVGSHIFYRMGGHAASRAGAYSADTGHAPPAQGGLVPAEGVAAAPDVQVASAVTSAPAASAPQAAAKPELAPSSTSKPLPQAAKAPAPTAS